MSEALTEKPIQVVDVRTLADAYRLRAELKDAEDSWNIAIKELNSRKEALLEEVYSQHYAELLNLETTAKTARAEKMRIEKDIIGITTSYAKAGIMEDGDYCLKDVARKPADVVNAKKFMADFPAAATPMISFSVTAVKAFLKASKTNAETYLLPKTWVPEYQVEKKGWRK